MLDYPKLGADRQATSATDKTEAAAGWYWQFNRKKGYKHDGITRTPNTSWNSSISEDSHWLPANDPCTLLLGSLWRLPTSTEWQTADKTDGWDNYNDTYASVLKLHAAGALSYINGRLDFPKSTGHYWGNLQDDSDAGWNFSIGFAGCGMVNNSKTFGFSIRCLSD